MVAKLRFGRAVADALSEGRPVVALESTIVSHGLPRPDNLAVARDVEELVRGEGATPATVGVVGGVPTVGLDDAELVRLATAAGVDKLSARDVAVAVALGRDGATTVAATAALAARAGVTVFATGGLGGVHRGARETWDESADLMALTKAPIVVVCAGVKSILDVPATLERLETLGVTVVGYGTDRFPGFYLTDAGLPVGWRVDSPRQAAAVIHAQRELGMAAGVIVANPVAPAEQLDPTLHDRTLREGLAAAERAGVRGRDLTPFLLEHFHATTAGESLRVNITILRQNARLAAAIAVAEAGR